MRDKPRKASWGDPGRSPLAAPLALLTGLAVGGLSVYGLMKCRSVKRLEGSRTQAESIDEVEGEVSPYERESMARAATWLVPGIALFATMAPETVSVLGHPEGLMAWLFSLLVALLLVLCLVMAFTVIRKLTLTRISVYVAAIFLALLAYTAMVHLYSRWLAEGA